ncbi:hypothetical protein BASA81_001695 [Batrachochytrium salamandrivorans]|nr:hypothetical protein BASA81_001695 [Batrachochytrium salamandrivorans]
MENSWIVLDSDQHQLLMRAQSATPTVSHTPPPPLEFSLQKLENLECGGSLGADDDDDDEEEEGESSEEEEEAAAPQSSSVRRALELAERSFEAIDASPTSSPLGLPSSSSSPMASANNDRYGGRGNPALRDLRGELTRPQSPLAEYRKPVSVRKQDLDNNNEDDDDDDTSSFTFTLMLALSHAVALVVGYYIGTRTLSSYSSHSPSSSSHSPSHGSSSAVGLLSIE